MRRKIPKLPSEAFDWSKCRDARSREDLVLDLRKLLADWRTDSAIAKCWPKRLAEGREVDLDPKAISPEERTNLSHGVFEQHIRETWTLREIETFDPFHSGGRFKLPLADCRWLDSLWKSLVYVCHTFAGAAVALDVREGGLFRRGTNGKIITMPTADVDPESGHSVLDLTLRDVQLMLASARDAYKAVLTEKVENEKRTISGDVSKKDKQLNKGAAIIEKLMSENAELKAQLAQK